MDNVWIMKLTMIIGNVLYNSLWEESINLSCGVSQEHICAVGKFGDTLKLTFSEIVPKCGRRRQ